MTHECSDIASQYQQEIRDLVKTQVEENREAIFFIYEDGSTTDVFKGEATQISLSREQESSIVSNGNIVGSVHSHPSGFDPSTIDIMTGVMSRQEAMCVAVPIYEQDVDEDFVLTCIDLSDMSFSQRRRMARAMRRSSIGVTEFGRQVRKQAALDRFGVQGCRTHEVEIDGIELPVTSRPSSFEIELGDKVGVEDVGEDVDFPV